MSLYSSKALAKESGASYRQVDYWVERGYLKPLEIEGTPERGSGNWRVFDDKAVAKAKLMVHLVNLEHVHLMAEALANDEPVAVAGRTLGWVDPPDDGLEQTAIEALHLSVRSYNVLKREGINTIHQLIEVYLDGTLRDFRNLGEKSYEELVTVVHQLRGWDLPVTGEE